MRRHLLLSLSLTAFLILAGSLSLRAQTSCSAASIFFGRHSCTIDCPFSRAAVCKNGLFSASCRCLPDAPYFPLNSISEDQYAAAISLRDFLNTLRPWEAFVLAQAIQRIIEAIEAGDEDAYSEAENNFADLFANMSEELREKVKAWFEENGYEFP